MGEMQKGGGRAEGRGEGQRGGGRARFPCSLLHCSSPGLHVLTTQERL